MNSVHLEKVLAARKALTLNLPTLGEAEAGRTPRAEEPMGEKGSGGESPCMREECRKNNEPTD